MPNSCSVFNCIVLIIDWELFIKIYFIKLIWHALENILFKSYNMTCLSFFKILC